MTDDTSSAAALVTLDVGVYTVQVSSLPPKPPFIFNEPISVDARIEGSSPFLSFSLDSLTDQAESYNWLGVLENYDGLESSLS